MKKILFTILAAVLSVAFQAESDAAIVIEPTSTYLYAQKDSSSLYLDIYEPAEGSVTEIDGIRKPTVIFIFGGGFVQGRRDDDYFNEWFKDMTDAGYRIVSIDYRLGLKSVVQNGGKISLKFIGLLQNAMDIAVEDLFSATNFIIDNADVLGIDPDNLVISGSSAGAMTSLQAEWEICNGLENATVLPEGFNYAGVMSFSGAIFSDKGSIKYTQKRPCPMLIFHGTKDMVVPYGKIQAFNLCFAGSDAISKALKKGGLDYAIYRCKDHGHEVAGSMHHFTGQEFNFLETAVMKGESVSMDILYDSPEYPVAEEWAKKSFFNLFKTK